MREIDTAVIVETIEKLCMQACYQLGDDVKQLLKQAREREESPFGSWILQQILDNIDVSREQQLPLCQDTGMAVVFIELGQDVHITGGSLTEAVNEGVRREHQKST